MRILHVIPQFPHVGGRTVIGGHASSLFTLALAQAERGDDVTILSYVHGTSGDIELAERLRVVSLFETAVPGTIRFGLDFRRAAARWALARRHDFDLVHCHSGFADYFVVSSRLKSALKLPTLHTMYCPIPREGGRWRLPGVHTVIKACANGLDGLVAMSENVASSMRDFGMRSVEKVPPPVDVDRFHPPSMRPALRATLGLAEDDVAVLFVGNAKPQKNLTGLLKAFHRVHSAHPHARLVITTELAQSSTDEHLNALAREIDELGLASGIIQKGIVENMPELMQACDMLAAPFLDSFGPSDYFMAALEAMACGRPVIVSAVGGMSEVVDDAVGRLVDPHDPAAIAAAIETFLTDPGLREATGNRARTLTESRFDPRAVADRYRQLYASIGSPDPVKAATS